MVGQQALNLLIEVRILAPEPYIFPLNLLRILRIKAQSFGSMEGSYQMLTEGGSHFDAEIARFDLREPGAIH